MPTMRLYQAHTPAISELLRKGAVLENGLLFVSRAMLPEGLNARSFWDRVSQYISTDNDRVVLEAYTAEIEDLLFSSMEDDRLHEPVSALYSLVHDLSSEGVVALCVQL